MDINSKTSKPKGFPIFLSDKSHNVSSSTDNFNKLTDSCYAYIHECIWVSENNRENLLTHPKSLSSSSRKLAIDATLTIASFWVILSKGINPHPQQGENGSKKNRPNNNNGWSTILPSKQTLQEWIKMCNHPYSKEKLSK